METINNKPNKNLIRTSMETSEDVKEEKWIETKKKKTTKKKGKRKKKEKKKKKCLKGQITYEILQNYGGELSHEGYHGNHQGCAIKHL